MSAAVGERAAPGELRRIFGLSWPVSLGGLGMMLMGAVDLAVVGRLGEGPLASLAAGNLWAFGILVPTQFALSGLDPVVAQAVGAGDRRAAGRALARGLALAMLLSVPAVVLQRLAAPGLALLGQPPEILPLAGAWCDASAWSTPAVLGFHALRAWLQAHGIVRPAMIVVLAATVVNLLLNLALVFGFGPVPALGVYGSGLATGLARVFMFLALAALTWGTLRAGWSAGPGALAPGPTLRLLVLGLPGAAQMALEVWAFQAAAIMMGWLGETALAANAIVLNLSSLSFMVPVGVSVAASARVGNLLGAGQPWARAAWTAVALGGGVMALFALLFLVAGGPLVGVYTREAGVAALAVSLLPVVAAFQVFDGTQVTCIGALRGAGDLRVPAITSLVAYWLLALPLGWTLAFQLDWGPRGVWTGMALGLAMAAAILVYRLRVVSLRGGTRLALDRHHGDAPA